MSQLIQMRQRIKAIETIKKVTHAMRLISMSSHTRLQGERSTLDQYHNEVSGLLNRVHSMANHNKSNLETDTITTTKKDPLVILIGSQKGLCGSFNTTLFSKFELFIKKNLQDKKFKIIIVGKQAIDSLKSKQAYSIVSTYDQLTSGTLHTLADSIAKNIQYPQDFYGRKAWVVSNELKSFFSQKPMVTQLLPLPEQINDSIEKAVEPFITEQPLDQIINYLEQEYLYSTVYHLLFESLLAEQAARFVSMDNATRNAQNLLESTCHEYNKLRQAKITRELAEITSSI